GFLVWSDSNLYRAKELLGALSPVADVGATGGARPWLTGALLRTPLGMFALDPGSPAPRRAAFPGIADALAIDARRAVRLDILGRASFTTDGGTSWTDVLATRGVVVNALSETASGDLLLTAAGSKGRFILGANGAIEEAHDPPSRGGRCAPGDP